MCFAEFADPDKGLSESQIIHKSYQVTSNLSKSPEELFIKDEVLIFGAKNHPFVVPKLSEKWSGDGLRQRLARRSSSYRHEGWEEADLRSWPRHVQF